MVECSDSPRKVNKATIGMSVMARYESTTCGRSCSCYMPYVHRILAIPKRITLPLVIMFSVIGGYWLLCKLNGELYRPSFAPVPESTSNTLMVPAKGLTEQSEPFQSESLLLRRLQLGVRAILQFSTVSSTLLTFMKVKENILKQDRYFCRLSAITNRPGLSRYRKC